MSSERIAAVRAVAERFLRALFSDLFSRGLPGYMELRMVCPGHRVKLRFFGAMRTDGR